MLHLLRFAAASACVLASASAGASAPLETGAAVTPRILLRVPRETDFPAIARCGVRLEHKIAVEQWIAVAAPSALACSGLTPLGEWSGVRKLAPRLAERRFPTGSVDPAHPGLVGTFVLLHSDVPLERLAGLSLRHGGILAGQLAPLRGGTVWLPEDELDPLAAEPEVLRVEPLSAPLLPALDGVRAALRIPELVAATGLEGSGVTILVYDGGHVRTTHQTWVPGYRVTRMEGDDDYPISFAAHATHIAGIAAGDGDGGRGRGVAPAAKVLSAYYKPTPSVPSFWAESGDIEADYGSARSLGADLATASLASSASSGSCDRLGDYGVSAALLDAIVRGDDPAAPGTWLSIWAAGNQRTAAGSFCGAAFRTMNSPGCAKNTFQIGGINSDGLSMTKFSSWGPCDDGRLQPILVAPSCETGRTTGERHVYSSQDTADDAYGPCYGIDGACGTSMAAPAAAGVIALLVEEWRSLGFGGATARPLPALVRALLVETARDLGPDGPDYAFGYGMPDAVRAISLLRSGSPLDGDLSTRFGTASASAGSVTSWPIAVPAGSDALRATLAWDDPAAAAFSTAPLVNDLDLELVDPSGTVHHPALLDPAHPEALAGTGVNTRDNLERAEILRPVAGLWSVRVRGASVPVAPQSFSLAIEALPRSIVASSCAPAIANGSFETDAAGWTLAGGAARAAPPAPGHGSGSLRFGGAVSAADSATLDVLVPAGAAAILRFSTYVESTEATDGTDHFRDFLYLDVTDTAGTVRATPFVSSDGFAIGSWLETRVDLSPWAGATVRIAFSSVHDESLPTTFFLDDVSLEICSGCAAGAAPAITAVSDPDACVRTGVAISFSPAAGGADRYDLLVDGIPTVPGFVSGGIAPLPDGARHVVSIRAVHGACDADSAPVGFVDGSVSGPCLPDVVALPGAVLSGITDDGDGFVEPGELWSALVTVENRGPLPAIGFLARASAAGFLFCETHAPFGNVAQLGGTASHAFRFVPDPAVFWETRACGSTVSIDLVDKSSRPAGTTFPPDVAFAQVTVGKAGPITETATQSTDPITATNGLAVSPLLPAISAPVATAASASWSASGTPSVTTCVEVRLRAPDGTDFQLKSFGQADPAAASGASLVSFYGAHASPGNWQIVVGERNTPACGGTPAGLSAGRLSVTSGSTGNCEEHGSLCAVRTSEVSGTAANPLRIRKGTGNALDVEFQDVGAASSNLYVSSSANGFPFDVIAPNGSRSCSAPTVARAGGRRAVPAFSTTVAGGVLYLLVSADSGAGTEGTLGTDTAGRERIASFPCAR